MIQVKFDPKNIRGSLLLTVAETKDGFASKLRDGVDVHSTHLRSLLSAATLQDLQNYVPGQPVPAALGDALILELNQLIDGPSLYDKKRFRGVQWRKERETLMKALIKDVEEGIKQKQNWVNQLPSFNRLLLEEIYQDDIVPSPKAEWESWNLLAAAATARVINAWEDWKVVRAAWKANPQGKAPAFKPKLEDDIWKGFRDWLKINVFHGKCAYCETRISGFPGDTEHFRPKGRVRDLNTVLNDGSLQIVKIQDDNGDEIEHPGYFWLAYHWKNLLPSCEYCNTAGGKGDVFPTERGHIGVKRLTANEIKELLEPITQSVKAPDVYYLQPGDLDRIEGRLLLHPYYDNPEEHIYYDVEGLAKPWKNSKLGEQSRKYFFLDEPSKLQARRDERAAAQERYMNRVAQTVDKDKLKQIAQDFMDEYYSGTKPYAAAVFDYIHFMLEPTRFDPAELLGPRRK